MTQRMKIFLLGLGILVGQQETISPSYNGYNNDNHESLFVLGTMALIIVTPIILYKLISRHHHPQKQYERAQGMIDTIENDSLRWRLVRGSQDQWESFVNLVQHEFGGSQQHGLEAALCKLQTIQNSIEQAHSLVNSALTKTNSSALLRQQLQELKTKIQEYDYKNKLLLNKIQSSIDVLYARQVLDGIASNRFIADVARAAQCPDLVFNVIHANYLNYKYPLLEAETYLRNQLAEVDRVIKLLSNISKEIAPWYQLNNKFYNQEYYINSLAYYNDIQQILVMINQSEQYRQELYRKSQADLERQRIEAQERAARAAEEQAYWERKRYEEKIRQRRERERREAENRIIQITVDTSSSVARQEERTARAQERQAQAQERQARAAERQAQAAREKARAEKERARAQERQEQERRDRKREQQAAERRRAEAQERQARAAEKQAKTAERRAQAEKERARAAERQAKAQKDAQRAQSKKTKPKNNKINSSNNMNFTDFMY